VVIFPSNDSNNTGSFDSDYKAKAREYKQEQFDKYCYAYVVPDSNIWTDIWHGAYAAGEIISGCIGIAGGIAIATGGSETGVLIPVGIIITAHGSDILASGINDLAGVFSENRVGYGYGNLGFLKSQYQKLFGKEWGSILYTGVDVGSSIFGVKAAFNAMRTGVKMTERSAYVIKSVLPNVNNLVKESYNTTVVLGIGERVVEGYVIIRDGSIIISNLQGAWEDITEWFK
jgi:hypothetical protein